MKYKESAEIDAIMKVESHWGIQSIDYELGIYCPGKGGPVVPLLLMKLRGTCVTRQVVSFEC
jgi:hypothetical protein